MQITRPPVPVDHLLLRHRPGDTASLPRVLSASPETPLANAAEAASTPVDGPWLAGIVLDDGQTMPLS